MKAGLTRLSTERMISAAVTMANEHIFRRMALALTDAVEREHMGHPDFRVNNRIFATLHHDRRTGMVVLTPEQQQTFVRRHEDVFTPESGAWGRSGCTRVHLAAVDDETLGEALTLAWQNSLAKAPAKRANAARARKAAPAPPRARGKR